MRDKFLSSDNSKYKDLAVGVRTFSLPAMILDKKVADLPRGTLLCPGACLCAQGCFAVKGRMGTMRVCKERRYDCLWLTRQPDFVVRMAREITGELKGRGHKPVEYVRIHDSGEFYSLQYFKSWMNICRLFPQLKFWAYTKMTKMVKDHHSNVPPNLQIVFSEGGWWDHLIDRDRDKHSRIFWDHKHMERVNGGYRRNAGATPLYADGASSTMGDIDAVFGPSNVGLVFHGQGKRFTTDPGHPMFPEIVRREQAYINGVHKKMGWFENPQGLMCRPSPQSHTREHAKY